MNKKSGLIRRFPFFYGYVIILSGTIGVLMSVPGQTVGISVFTDYLIKDLPITRESLSLAYLIGTFGSSLILTYAGRFFDKFGARVTSTLAGLFLGIALLYLSEITLIGNWLSNVMGITNWQILIFILLVLGFFLVRFFGQGVLTMSSRNMVMKWFDRRRGLATAIVGIATSFGFSYSPRILDWFIASFGWQGAWQTLALIIGVSFVLFAWITYRDNPQEYDLLPDGKLVKVKSKNTPIYHPERDYTLKEARTTYSFWIFNLSLALYVLYITAFTFHIVDIFAQAGISRDEAIAIFLPASVVALVFQISGGYISDYIQLKYLLMIQLAGFTIASIGFAILTPGLPVYLIIFGNGMAGGIFGVLSSVTWPRFFGTKHLGEISGFNMSWIVFGSAVGPFLFSILKNTFSGYFAAGIFCLAASLVLFILSLKANNVNLKKAD